MRFGPGYGCPSDGDIHPYRPEGLRTVGLLDVTVRTDTSNVVRCLGVGGWLKEAPPLSLKRIPFRGFTPTVLRLCRRCGMPMKKCRCSEVY